VLVCLDAPDTVEALRHHAAPAHVIAGGRLLDRARMAALAQAGGSSI
jgi:hypothetical protein